MNPYFRVGADRGRQPTKKASVFAVYENIHVTAKLALFIKDTVAKAWKLAGNRADDFRCGHAAGCSNLQVNDVAAAGPFAQHRRNMHAHVNSP